MLKCKECGDEKPDQEVHLGVCDHCFNFGSPAKNTGSFGSSGPRDADGSISSSSTLSRNLIQSEIILTTSIDVPNREIDSVISIVAAEAALGMNIFRDIANNWRDFVGGRASSSQKALKEARAACLEELKQEAASVGAHAVIAVDLDYNELSTSGSGGILFVAATGTAVRLKPAL